MALRVQKFGGSSLCDHSALRRCAQRAVDAQRGGDQVAVVVSAQGRQTDALIELARRINAAPPRRELDTLLATGEQASAALMAMAIAALDVPAVSLPAACLGLRTDHAHCNARIRSIDADRLRAELAAGRIVVAPGFQGLSAHGDITTLGRGGSDLTAVAIAAALGVRHGCGVCEIFTDVDGVYTADPRHVPTARKLQRLSFEEMVELADLGAAVLHSRAVMFAQRFAVPIHVRHSTLDAEGTMIVRETPDMERVNVVGCAMTADLGRLTVRHLPDRPGTQSVLFEHIARAGIVVDDIIQTQTAGGIDVTFTVELPRVADVKLAARDAVNQIGAGDIDIEVGLTKISAVGVGMRTHGAVAATMFKALGEASIPIANITTSEIKISCLVPAEHGPAALRAVHDAFDLSRPPGPRRDQPRAAATVVVDPAAPRPV